MEGLRNPDDRLLFFPRASLDFVEKCLHKILRWFPGRSPLFLFLITFSADMHVLPVAERILKDYFPLKHGGLCINKTYMDTVHSELLEKSHSFALLTPRKSKGVMC